MKVIKDGLTMPNEEATREFWCQQCNSVIEASISEFGPAYPDDRDGAYHLVTCPVCKTTLYLSAEAVENDTLYNGGGSRK